MAVLQNQTVRADGKFELDDLSSRDVSDSMPYLSSGSLKYACLAVQSISPLSCRYVFVSHSFRDQRQVFVLYFSGLQRARVFIVDSRRYR